MSQEGALFAASRARITAPASNSVNCDGATRWRGSKVPIGAGVRFGEIVLRYLICGLPPITTSSCSIPLDRRIVFLRLKGTVKALIVVAKNVWP